MNRLSCYSLFLLFSPMALAQTSFLELAAGFARIEAEVAAGPQERQRGLMRREKMAETRGMLFVFPEAARYCMWMRNTLIPLSVAFLDERGKIINIENMSPQTDDNHCAKRPARYALEMNLGWFASKGIVPGMRIRGVEKAPAPR